MSDPQTLQDLLNVLQDTMNQIQEHYEWNDSDGPLKVFDVVAPPILPLLHNYKWRENILVEKANQILGQSPGVHGSDGRKVEEIESKSAKLKGRVIKLTDCVGMYDKIASRVDFDEDLDASPLLDLFNNGPIREEEVLKMIRNTVLRGKNGQNIAFSSPRRANRLLQLMEKNSVLQRDKFNDLELGQSPWFSLDWPPTLLSIGVARHEHSVFGLFGANEKALVVVMCESADIEQVLGPVFEKRFEEYTSQMATRKNDNHGKATSARDAVKISLEDVLNIPSSKIIHLDVGAMWKEKIKMETMLTERIKKMSNARTSNGTIKQQVERYEKQFGAYEDILKNNKKNKM